MENKTNLESQENQEEIKVLFRNYIDPLKEDLSFKEHELEKIKEIFRKTLGEINLPSSTAKRCYTGWVVYLSLLMMARDRKYITQARVAFLFDCSTVSIRNYYKRVLKILKEGRQ